MEIAQMQANTKLLTVWTVTFNDDYSTPYCEVYQSEDEALNAVLDYLDVPGGEDGTDRAEAITAYANGDLNDWLSGHDYIKTDGDSYIIQSHTIGIAGANRFDTFTMVELREIQQAFAFRIMGPTSPRTFEHTLSDLFEELLEVIHEREDELERISDRCSEKEFDNPIP